MKKGFTLIEMVSIIIIIGIVAMIAIPTVNLMIKNGKEDLYNNQLDEIKLAAEKWAFNNLSLLPDEEGKSVTITLLQLKKGGYLPLDIRDPRDNNLLSNGLSITITYKDNDYEYDIKNVITNTEITNESPSILLNGLAVETVEVGTKYNEKGAVATDSKGTNLSNIQIIYYENGKQVATVDTTKLNTYTVEYSVTDLTKNLTTVITRTVIVKDSEAPVIILPSKVTISSSQATNYDLLQGVTITDNSGENIKPEISGFDTSKGEKVVSYKACDSSLNCATEKRIIVVN
ncbi:MAG: DUF5011 domain-containing protein [Firmicutes bacterium]|nr:DUF5011 domain-containing protein [Bacillota bacterium]